MKLVVINIEYNKDIGDGEFEDIISFTCPFKQHSVSLHRSDIDNFTLADIIEQKEFEHYKHDERFYGTSIKFTAKIEDSDYNILFKDCVDYTPEKRNNDLSNMFTWLSWKIADIYRTPEMYDKYLKNIDYDGSIDGCVNCIFWHKNDYCTKTNKISPNKACPYYKFKRNK